MKRFRWLTGKLFSSLEGWLPNPASSENRKLLSPAEVQPLKGRSSDSDWDQIIPPTELLACWALNGRTRGLAIDIGSGNGELGVELAHQAPDMRIVCLDLDYQMLQTSYLLAIQGGSEERMAFCKAAAQHIPFADQTFDLIVSTRCLHHWADPVGVFNEIARVIKPNGRFFVFDVERSAELRPSALDDTHSFANMALTSEEAEQIAARSQLRNHRVIRGRSWLIIESVDTDAGWSPLVKTSLNSEA